MEKKSKVITPKSQDYSQWYNDIVVQAGLADHSAVRGCMVIKPYGYAIWERIQATLDKRFKETGHVNAYFPLFIPKSFLSREASHVEGFAKECAVVTHYRLINDPSGQGVVVDPEARLEEELIVRPTSETIIWSTYKDWIQSYRDLPILINQWANVVRWEMRTRLFLRTTEFLWQEGHTAHASEKEAIEETLTMLDVYEEVVQNTMAIPVIKGVKTPQERFAGAVETYCIEALMQDGKALQAGTSHYLGQNFAKAFDVRFLNQTGTLEHVYATSWGVSTRLMGALIMTHSDDLGLVLPPELAPFQVVIIPIVKGEKEPGLMNREAQNLAAKLGALGVRCKVDQDDTRTPGWKYAEYEMKGVPLRLALGQRDLDAGVVELARRDTREKKIVPAQELLGLVPALLKEIQQNLFQKAQDLRTRLSVKVDDFAEFQRILDTTGGFILAHWDGTKETEAQIKELTKATIRCIPLDNQQEAGQCILTGKPSSQRVIFARAY